MSDERKDRESRLAEIDAEYMLENIMHRENWTPAVRDEIAAKLLHIVRLCGGDYSKISLPKGGKRSSLY